MEIPAEYNDVLRDLAECIEEAVTRIAAADPASSALVIVEAIRARFGGSLVYIPTGAKLNRAARNAELYAAFTGRNHRELAQRYGLTVSKVYDVIAAHRGKTRA